MAKNSLMASGLFSNKKIEAVAVLLSSITHEVNNYLATIGINSELLRGKLSNIKKEIEDSESNLRIVRRTVKNAGYLVNNLQLQIKGIITGNVDKKDFKQYSMLKNIEEALGQYPFKPGECELVKVNRSKDFEYIGNPVLTNHILYNLIKNALRAIKNADKGSIVIELEYGERFNKLVFRDTATGIPKEFLPKMFQLFESRMTAQGGTGIGLAFCKMIMNSYGGDIGCSSVEREYTEFMLSFPSLK